MQSSIHQKDTTTDSEAAISAVGTEPPPADPAADAKTAGAGPTIDFPDTIYSKYECYIFVVCVSLGQICSTISTPIYFPALTPVAEYFHTSPERINLTQTMYTLFQGISPVLFATISDSVGRRPMYFICVTIYLGANVGLALAPSYWVLFGLRCLQAAGISTCVALVGGVIGDVTQRKNRGGLMGAAQGLGQLGNCFGPLIGGALLGRWNWRSIFWFLLALGALLLACVFVFLPETSRQFTGNGSLMPRQWWLRSPYAYTRAAKQGVPYMPDSPHYNEQWRAKPHKLRFFRWAYMFIQPDVLLVLVPNALHFASWFMVLTAQSNILYSAYGFNPTRVGLSYLSSGLGTFLGSLFTGELMQQTYKREMKRFEEECAEKNVPADPVNFNIYRARLGPSFYATGLLVVSMLVFAWTIQRHVTAYVPIIMTFFISAAATFFLATTSTLLVDLFPGDSAASVSCSNLSRCSVCAAGIAAVDKMVRAMGAGGTFTLMAGLCGLSLVCLVAEIRYGKLLAQRRQLRESAREGL